MNQSLPQRQEKDDRRAAKKYYAHNKVYVSARHEGTLCRLFMVGRRPSLGKHLYIQAFSFGKFFKAARTNVVYDAEGIFHQMQMQKAKVYRR